MNTDTTQRKEAYYSLHDLLWYTVSQWKTILLCTLVFAVLFAVIWCGHLLKIRKEQQEEKDKRQTEAVVSKEEGDPAILLQPEDVTIPAGEEAVFTIATSGKVKSYRWQYSMDGISWINLNLSSHPSAATDSYHLITKPTENKYIFRCQITFAEGTVLVSDEALLTLTTLGASMPELSSRDIVRGTANYFVFGAIFGFLLSAVAVVGLLLKREYLVNRYIIKTLYGLPCFGIYEAVRKDRLTQFALNRLTYWNNLKKQDVNSMIAVKLAIKAVSNKDIFLVGTVPESILNKLAVDLDPHLSKNIFPVGNLNTNPAAVQGIIKAENVVCVEDITKSSRRFIDEEMDVIKSSQSDCIGFILVM